MTEFVEWNGKRWYLYDGYWKNRAGKLLHREVYMAANGYIPPSVDIHHIDGDRANYALSNLRALSRAEHMNQHEPRPITPSGAAC